MAPTHPDSKPGQDHEHNDGDEEAYLGEEDVYEEFVDEGDHPMDEDDEEADQLGDLPVAGSSHDLDDDDDDIVWEDNSIQHFPDHRKSVFAISTHPTQHLAASGGEDDLGYIWDFTTGEEIVKLSGHTDSVISTAFSYDGEMIATGGMDGKVRVWRRVGKTDFKTWEFLTELQGPDELMVRFTPSSHTLKSTNTLSKWIKWHPKGSVLLAGSNDSNAWLWQCTCKRCDLCSTTKPVHSTLRQRHASARRAHWSCAVRDLYAGRQADRNGLRRWDSHVLGSALPDTTVQAICRGCTV